MSDERSAWIKHRNRWNDRIALATAKATHFEDAIHRALDLIDDGCTDTSKIEELLTGYVRSESVLEKNLKTKIIEREARHIKDSISEVQEDQ